ncbi:MAG: hypothetical protein ACI843_002099 [Psychrobacter glaciei]|jgi:hypothetical protein
MCNWSRLTNRINNNVLKTIEKVSIGDRLPQLMLLKAHLKYSFVQKKIDQE